MHTQEPHQIHRARALQFDARAIVHRLGGPTAIVRKLDKYGLPGLTVKAIEKWQTRNSIPSHRLAHLCQIADIEGIDLDLRGSLRSFR